MGLLTGLPGTTSEDGIRKEAAKARTNGDRWFTPRMFTKLKTGGGSNEWAHCIAAAEDEGWELVQWSVAQGGADVIQAFPVFKRRT